MSDCNDLSCGGPIQLTPEPTSPALSAESVRTVLAIAKMDCPTEEAMIRGKLTGMAGIEGLDFNLIQRRLTLTHRPEAIDAAVKALGSLGLEAVVESEVTDRESATQGPTVSRRRWALLAVAAIAATAAEVLDLASPDSRWLIIALSLLAVGTGGLETYWKGVIALRNRTLNINALMSVAVTGAIVIGEWPEAAMVMVLFALAEVIESLSLDRARRAIRQLMAMAPETATVQGEDGRWAEVETKRVAVGSIVRVGPGGRIPLDGAIANGSSTVNQAPITGESMPVEKEGGDQVFAGTINGAGSFEYRVTKTADDSTLSRIIHAVEEAQGTRAPTQRFVDRFARIYTPTVFGLAVLVALIPPLAFGQPFLSWIYRALVLLVIGCPCALVISTPVTVVSGLASAARRGILVKGGVYLEQGRKLRVFAFDKTGTITKGEPAVTDFVPQPGREAEQALVWAASLAARSDHPLSRAIAAYAAQRSVLPAELAEFAALPGRGTKGRLNGEWLYLGSHRVIEDLNLCSPALEVAFEALERQGKSLVVLATDAEVVAVFGIADTVRETSRSAIADLHTLGVRTVMLSGDNQLTATAIAAQVGIDDARGSLLPEEKLAAIEALVEQFGQVGMAGDGINDAPALAASSIGFAMGVAGSDTALETADVALMDDDLRKLPAFIRLSRLTARILTQNISLALGIKAVFLGLAVAGTATLWMAILADMGASLLVIFNGLRLLEAKAPFASGSEEAIAWSPPAPLEAGQP
ncbi:MAG: heavy metal translocating P-type ATPase [Actinobacteria bacterium]|nr:heavy metal translocating P-type ATPase [Actinomycetota bacterium]